jgi:hypothetical protein
MTRIPTIVALCAAGLLVSAGCTAPTVRTAGVEAVGLRKICDIRSVYQIKTDEWKEGVGAGLHYVQKLLDTYNDLGVPDAAARRKRRPCLALVSEDGHQGACCQIPLGLGVAD